MNSGPVPLINGIPLTDLSRLGRVELLRSAVNWTSRYRELAPVPDPALADSMPFVLSGHQPTLFHPGVWFKNFILSRLGQQLKGVAVNLVIDNDVSGMPAVLIPSVGTQRVTWQSIPYDTFSERLPYEFQSFQDPGTLASFPNRLAAAVSPWVSNPLVNRLWPHVLETRKVFPELGFALAAARHRLESESKLQTLEVPLSQVCRSRAFSHFVAEIFSRPAEFAAVYNRCLVQYRQRHGIRSPSHPLPPLDVAGNSVELPFWIYSREHPARTRLVVNHPANNTEFSGPDGQTIRIDSSDPAEQLYQLSAGPICIRPRALLTTMFCRLVLSDLFVHGIGGAVYDQITDAIAADFFHWVLPPFVTSTGTFRLAGWSPMAAASQLAFLKGQLRLMIHHPENAVSHSTRSESLIEAKRTLISEMDQSAGRRQRHMDMVRLNGQLRDLLGDRQRLLEQEIEAKQLLLEQNRIVASREVSFCAHPETLVTQLSVSAAAIF